MIDAVPGAKILGLDVNTHDANAAKERAGRIMRDTDHGEGARDKWEMSYAHT